MGRALLDELEAWAWDQGAAAVTSGAAAPFYLWPGVDVRALAMSCLAEQAGYRDIGLALNMSVPATFRAPTPDGFAVERVLEDDDVARVDALVARHWPEWTPETARRPGPGLVLRGVRPAIAGRSASPATRSTGPAGSGPPAPIRRAEGPASATPCWPRCAATPWWPATPTLEISWIGPMRFYAKAGGSVSRVFRMLHKAKP